MDSKHVCKFCKKSFPCGRSLGGHIRSHLVHNNSNSGNGAPNEEPKLVKPGSGPGYELRENPKKTNKAADLSLMGFSSSSLCTKSDGEDGKRSMFVGGNNSNSSVSEVVEPEQEEVAVAMSLIMLSRDVVKTGEDVSSGNVCLLQDGKNRGKNRREKKHSSKKIENLETKPSGFLQNGSKDKGFEVLENGFASNDQTNSPHESKNSVSSPPDSSGKRSEKMEFTASGYLQNGSKMMKSEVPENGLVSNDQISKPPKRKRKPIGPKKQGFSPSVQVMKNVSKMKDFEVSENGSASNDQTNNNPEMVYDQIPNGSENLPNSEKRSKFECTTCNKVFYSYQALGGHRASHKKLLGLQQPSDPTNPNLESNGGDFPSNGEIGIGSSSSSSPTPTPTPTPMKVAQKHECPICFRVFPSGQALGGHKRSHLLAANTTSISVNTPTNDTNKDTNNVIEKSPSSEMREFLDLDLNLPPAEDGATIPTGSSSNNLVGLIKPYWYEPLLSLVSN